MRTSIALLAVTAALASFVAACSSDGGDLGFPADDTPGADTPAPDTHTPTCSELQKSYTGFSGQKLEAGRLEAPIGIDRARMKPYEALGDDYKRVLAGVTPTVLGESGPTFGQAPDRWFIEPQPGAVSLYQAYRIAFEGCLEYTKTDAKYAAAPTPDTAGPACAAMARAFWSQTPSPDEIAACTDYAVNGANEEAAPGGKTTVSTDPRRRWAYACAAVLTTTGFLTY